MEMILNKTERRWHNNHLSYLSINTSLGMSIANHGLGTTFLNLYAADTLLKYDSTFAKTVIQNYCSFYPAPATQRTFFRTIWTTYKDTILNMIDRNCMPMSYLIEAALNKDAAANYMMNDLDAGSVSEMLICCKQWI